MRIIFVQIVLVLAKRQLVSLLIPTVVVWLLLHGVICQVNQLISEIIVDEGARRGSKVAIVVRVAFKFIVGQGQHAKASNIKLALVVESWALNILLHYESLLAIIVALAKDALDLG